MSWFKKFITDLFVKGFKEEKSPKCEFDALVDEIMDEYKEELQSLAKR